MEKHFVSNLYAATIGGIVAGIVVTALGGICWYFINKIDDQEKSIVKLQRNIDVIFYVLNDKAPNANISNLVHISEEKNISPEKTSTVILLLQKEPAQAKTYLKERLNFDASEINDIIEASPKK